MISNTSCWVFPVSLLIFTSRSLFAGSDAAATRSEGVVCRGTFAGRDVLGMKLNWSKRYITLSPIATLIGRLDVEVEDVDLPEAGIDVALLILSYHDLYYVVDDDSWPKIDGEKMLADFNQSQIKNEQVIRQTTFQIRFLQQNDVTRRSHINKDKGSGDCFEKRNKIFPFSIGCTPATHENWDSYWTHATRLANTHGASKSLNKTVVALAPPFVLL